MQFPTLHSILDVDTVDFTETRTLLLGFVTVVLTAIEFGLIFFLVGALGLATLDMTGVSPGLGILLGFLPAVVLGVGIPLLVQYRSAVAELNQSVVFRAALVLATIGTYTALFVYHPVASVFFAIIYLGGRVVTISGIYGFSRVRASLA